MILVTGGTGLVGSHLLWELITHGKKPVKAIYRKKKSLEKTLKLFNYMVSLEKKSTSGQALFNEINWIYCTLDDVPQLEHVFTDVTQVYHCAAKISFNPKHFDYLQKVNVEGTANIVNLSLKHNVDKFCMVSSVAALGNAVNGNAVNEETLWEAKKSNSVYSITKFASEMEVWRGSQEGLNVVIVNPGIILGEGEYNDGSGFIFKQVFNENNYIIPGSTGFVDVKDVISAMILLMQSTIKNERYILIGHHLGFPELSSKIARQLGVKSPNKILKPWQLSLAWKIDWLLSLFGKKRQLFKTTAQSALKSTRYDTSKLTEEINFNYTPLNSTIKRISKHFLLTRRRD